MRCNYHLECLQGNRNPDNANVRVACNCGHYSPCIGSRTDEAVPWQNGIKGAEDERPFSQKLTIADGTKDNIAISHTKTVGIS